MTERFEGEGAKAWRQPHPLLVPGCELLHQLCASRLMAALGQQARVLLVGVGTGSELLLLGRLCPPAGPLWPRISRRTCWPRPGCGPSRRAWGTQGVLAPGRIACGE